MNGMKAMFWKELRECLKWGLLGLAGMLLALGYVVNIEYTALTEGSQNVPMTSLIFLTVASFGSIGTGGLLGLLQILPERGRDRWAMLIHRPLSPRRLLLAKMAAGALVYLVAVGLPLLLCVLLAATPGLYPAPFVPTVYLPMLYIMLGGLVFYAWGLLVGLERGWWLGRRGILAAGAVLLVASVQGAVWSTFVIIMPLVLLGLYVLAALGTIHSEHNRARRPWHERCAYALVMLYSVASVMVLGVYVITISLALTGRLSDSPGNRIYESMFITQDAQLFLMRQQSDGGKQVILNLDGTPVPDQQKALEDDYGNNAYGVQVARDVSAPDSNFNLNAYNNDSPLLWNNVLALQLWDGRDKLQKQRWFYLVREGYFIGYNEKSRQPVAICDREGFKPADATPVPFPGRLYFSRYFSEQPRFFHVGGQVYSIDLEDRVLTRILDGSEPVAGVGQMEMIYQGGQVVTYNRAVRRIHPRYSHPTERGIPEEYERAVPVYAAAIALPTELRLITAEGKHLATLPYRADKDTLPYLSLIPTDDVKRFFLNHGSMYGNYVYRDGEYYNRSLVNEYLTDGTYLKQYVVDIYYNRPERMSLIMQAQACLGVPPGLLVIMMMVSDAKITSPGSHWMDSVVCVWTMAAFCALCMGVMLWLSRRAGFGLARRLGWTVIILLTGLAGFLTFLVAAPWPERIPCPKCGKRRRVDAETCPACGADWQDGEPHRPLIGDRGKRTSPEPAASET